MDIECPTVSKISCYLISYTLQHIRVQIMFSGLRDLKFLYATPRLVLSNHDDSQTIVSL